MKEAILIEKLKALQNDYDDLLKEKNTLYESLMLARQKYNNDKARYRRKAKSYKARIDRALEIIHCYGCHEWETADRIISALEGKGE